MNAAYLNEIQNRVFAPVTDLDSLCKDIPMEMYAPFEYVSNNGFYGIDMALKQYAGLPHSYRLKAHYSHMSQIFEGTAWVKDYDTLPTLFTWAPSHEEVYKKVCRKPMYSIGPIIHYAQNAYTEEKIAAEKKRLGRNALFFPKHSTHYISAHFSIEESLTLIKNYEKDFDTIRVSMYWKDFLDGKHKPYMDYGYECVTSGHLFDPYFLSRLKGLLSVADHTFGNADGANIGYAVYMKKPFTFLQQETWNDASKDPAPVKNLQHAANAEKKTCEFLKYFKKYSPQISAVQYNLCNYYFGYDKVRSREELLTLIQASEVLFKKIVQGV